MTVLTYFETRWQCRGCGKFVAESTVHSRDYVPTREREVPQS